MATKGKDSGEVQVLEVDQGTIEFYILGTTPLIMNSMSLKVMQELLAPKGRKTAVEKASSMKHDPMVEYRASCYRMPDGSETVLGGPATWFKAAMCNAALDIPGAKKAQIGRLTYVNGQMLPIYGIPEIFCSVTRSADINKTPDVRTRAILPKWATRVSVTFIRPMLREQSISNLLASAGLTMGVGDWRQQKGSGNYGLFRLVSQDDSEYQMLLANGGESAQLDALESP